MHLTFGRPIAVTLLTRSHPIFVKLGKDAADAALRHLLLTDARGHHDLVWPLDVEPPA